MYARDGTGDMQGARTVEEHCAERGLAAPTGLSDLLNSGLTADLDGLLYRPDVSDGGPTSLSRALDILRDAVLPAPYNPLPLLPVDDASIACAICAPLEDPDARNTGRVIRWHLSDIPADHQGALLDDDVESYVRSVASELSGRRDGLAKIKQISRRYQSDYVAPGTRPPAWVERPIQLACQNVIIGLAAFAHDSTFDGLRVPAYLSCEVPHLATNEANRALAALMLCDAFQNGGTMEIRFGVQPKWKTVPPGLRRFGRSLGIELGEDDHHAITPAEARQLFLAVTPMPIELRGRAIELMDAGVLSPERLCYSLLAPIWSAIELDYIIATSSRVASILEGGAPVARRTACLAELEVSRAALMSGMFFRRVDGIDGAAGSLDEVRFFDDSRVGVEWTVNRESGAVRFSGVPAGTAPWSAPSRNPIHIGDRGGLVIIPRSLPIATDHALVSNLRAEYPEVAVALLVPVDMEHSVPLEIPLLLCPDRLGELDIEIERKLLSSRVGRA